MKNKLGSLGWLCLLLAVNLGIGIFFYAGGTVGAYCKNVTNIEKLLQMQRLVRLFYVDTADVEIDTLLQNAATGLPMALDPYSQYFPPAEAKGFMQEATGEFGGIGIVALTSNHDFVLVESVMADTPASRAGILPGDRIVQVDGVDVASIGAMGAIGKMRGEVGKPLKIVVISGNDVTMQTSREISLIREKISVQTIINQQTLQNGKIGYLMVTQFSGHTANDFLASVRQMVSAGIESLIVDLRGNGGGLLTEAVKMAGAFLPEGTLIVSVEGNDASAVEHYYSDGDDKVPSTIKLVLLLDRFSASASEVMAGALKDTGRAVLIGENSYGKGSVQNVFDFDDGSSMKLTIAKYFTPSHVTIHGVGIAPDIPVDIPNEIRERILFAGRGLQIDSDPVIQAAIKYLSEESTVISNGEKHE